PGTGRLGPGAGLDHRGIRSDAGDMPRRPGAGRGVAYQVRVYATQQAFTKPVVASATVGISSVIARAGEPSAGTSTMRQPTTPNSSSRASSAQNRSASAWPDTWNESETLCSSTTWNPSASESTDDMDAATVIQA